MPAAMPSMDALEYLGAGVASGGGASNRTYSSAKSERIWQALGQDFRRGRHITGGRWDSSTARKLNRAARRRGGHARRLPMSRVAHVHVAPSSSAHHDMFGSSPRCTLSSSTISMNSSCALCTPTAVYDMRSTDLICSAWWRGSGAGQRGGAAYHTTWDPQSLDMQGRQGAERTRFMAAPSAPPKP